MNTHTAHFYTTRAHTHTDPVSQHIADLPKEENFEFKFRTSHSKSVQGVAAFPTSNDVIVWSWDSSGSMCAWSGRNFEQLRTHAPDPKRGIVNAALAISGELWIAAERAVTIMDGEVRGARVECVCVCCHVCMCV